MGIPKENVYSFMDLRQRRLEQNSKLNQIEVEKMVDDKTSNVKIIEQIEEMLHNLKERESCNEIAYDDINNEEVDRLKSEIVRLKNEVIRLKNEIIMQREECDMKIDKIKNLNKVHLEFIFVSTFTLVISLIGLLIFGMSGFYIIHPSIYIMGIFMGIGWGATAITSIVKTRR